MSVYIFDFSVFLRCWLSSTNFMVMSFIAPTALMILVSMILFKDIYYYPKPNTAIKRNDYYLFIFTFIS